MEIKVKEKEIEVRRKDSNDSIKIEDNDFREGFLHFGRREAGFLFSDVEIEKD